MCTIVGCGVVPCLDCAVLLGWDCTILPQLLRQRQTWLTRKENGGFKAEEHWEDLPLGPGELAFLTKGMILSSTP